MGGGSSGLLSKASGLSFFYFILWSQKPLNARLYLCLDEGSEMAWAWQVYICDYEFERLGLRWEKHFSCTNTPLALGQCRGLGKVGFAPHASCK